MGVLTVGKPVPGQQTHQMQQRRLLLLVPLLLLLQLLLQEKSTCYAARVLGEGPGSNGVDLGSKHILNDAPLPQAPPKTFSRTASTAPPRTGLTVSLSTRASSKSFYQTYYEAAKPKATWTGSQRTCTAGDITKAFRDAVALRVNYFRAMAGVPADITFKDEYNAKAQKAALIMSANGELDHFPSTSWKCYTNDGAEGARSCNLALGISGWTAIDDYIKDWGDGNEVVGHRRWILYPQSRQFGTGDVTVSSQSSFDSWVNAESNALWVLDNANFWSPRPTTRTKYIAWPPPGFVPHTVVFPRWSFTYPGAKFASARVTMSRNGVPLALTQYTPVAGFGEENTLVWELASIPKPNQDTRYNVTVRSVSINGRAWRFGYIVTVFDPAK